MKRVSFKTAKALKEAGFPQDKGEYYYSYTGHLFHEKEAEDEETESLFFEASYAPYAMEVWLWLWREKNIDIDIITDVNRNVIAVFGEDIDDAPVDSDPEEAIVQAIEHIVENKLLK